MIIALKTVVSLDRIILENFLKESAQFEPVREDYTSKLQIFLQNALLIMIQNLISLKPFMGMLAWKNSPAGRILKSDTVVARNYLKETEIKKLERAVSGYFDYIERLIENRTTLTMESLAESVNKFLEFNEYKILEGKGRISHRNAEVKAYAEYDEFNKIQKIESDFDREIRKMIEKKE